MNYGKALFVLASSSCLAAAPASAERRTYGAICEASAAAIINRSHVAVASDDHQTILTYQRGQQAPVARFDLGDEMTDVEAAARIGDTVFWVTSHSLNSSGEDKKKRKVFFATKVASDGTLASDGKKYRHLREDLAAALGMAETTLMPTLNIEGMASTPDGHVLIGLRGPQDETGEKAFLIEISNPADLIASAGDDARAKIVRVVRLNLSDGAGTPGRGIRDIARVGERYLILAGSQPDGGVPPTKLFWWDGHSDGATAGPSADFSGMTPEAIAVWSETDAEVFSDNGGAVIDGKECGDKSPPANAFFPAVDITL